jgi:hypothetical protein
VPGRWMGAVELWCLSGRLDNNERSMSVIASHGVFYVYLRTCENGVWVLGKLFIYLLAWEVWRAETWWCGLRGEVSALCSASIWLIGSCRVRFEVWTGLNGQKLGNFFGMCRMEMLIIAWIVGLVNIQYIQIA